MTDLQLVLRTICFIFLTCAASAILLVALDAIFHLPLADFLVKKFADLLTLCVGALAGLLAGHHFGQKQSRQSRTMRDESLVKEAINK